MGLAVVAQEDGAVTPLSLLQVTDCGAILLAAALPLFIWAWMTLLIGY